LSPENSIVADGPALKYKNILIVRTDRIGDVVLTLPLIQVLRRTFPFARISFLARTYTKEIVEEQPGLDGVVLYDNEGVRKPFLSMLFELRRARYDLAIVAFPRFRIALLLWLSRIKVRIGSGYRWYSFFFNNRVYEHRKNAEKHELEYNLALVKDLGCEVPFDIAPSITLQEEALNAATKEAKRLQISGKDTVAILHPGSGGSARDWNAASFSLLARRLTEMGWKIVVTGAAGEEELVRNVVLGSRHRLGSSVGVLSLKGLAAFIKSADLFVSNSTGPLHIAAAVGTPVIGFYPPIVACSPQRWGPITRYKIVFVPDRSQCILCKGGACTGNVCMEQIGVQQVVNAAIQLVTMKKSGKKSIKVPAYS
jgi:heptosyltransferase III